MNKTSIDPGDSHFLAAGAEVFVELHRGGHADMWDGHGSEERVACGAGHGPGSMWRSGQLWPVKEGAARADELPAGDAYQGHNGLVRAARLGVGIICSVEDWQDAGGSKACLLRAVWKLPQLQGHWTRLTGPIVNGELSYKPPAYHQILHMPRYSNIRV